MNESRKTRQALIASWARAAFGEEQATALPHRGIRVVEEAIELAQAAGTDPAMIHKLVDYVYGRPVGEIGQELGGLGVTMLALASAAGISAEEEEAKEVDRVLRTPLLYFSQRNALKNEAGFDASKKTEEEWTPKTVLRAMLLAYEAAALAALEDYFRTQNPREETAAMNRHEKLLAYASIIRSEAAAVAVSIGDPEPVDLWISNEEDGDVVQKDYEARLQGERPLNTPPAVTL